MSENTEYVNAVGDVGILCAIDALMTKRNFAKSINPMFGTVRPLSELASQYVKSAILAAAEKTPELPASELNYYLTCYDPYYRKMSRICKNQMMHDSVDEILEGLTEQQGEAYLRKVGSLVKSARAAYGEDYYLSGETLSALAKADEAGMLTEKLKGEQKEEQKKETAGQMPQQPESPLGILLKEGSKDDHAAEWREYNRNLRTAVSDSDRNRAFDTFCEQCGMTPDELSAKLKVLTPQSIVPTPGKTQRTTPEMMAILQPYVNAAAKAGKMGTIVRKLYNQWHDGLDADSQRAYDRVKAFKTLSEFTKEGASWVDDKKDQLDTILGSPALSEEDKRAYAAMMIIDNIYRRRGLNIKDNGGLIPMFNRMNEVIGIPSQVEGTEGLMSELGIKRAKPYLDIIEKYASSSAGADNIYVAKWLFDFYNRNQIFNWARDNKTKSDRDKDFEVYFNTKVMPGIYTAWDEYKKKKLSPYKTAYKAAYDEWLFTFEDDPEKIPPNASEEETWKIFFNDGDTRDDYINLWCDPAIAIAYPLKDNPMLSELLGDPPGWFIRKPKEEERTKFMRRYHEWETYSQDKRGDEQDYANWGNNINPDSFDSKEQQVQEHNLKMDHARNTKPKLHLSEYAHMGDSQKASQFRDQVLDILDKYPFLSEEGYTAKALRVQPNLDMKFDDELVDFYNQMSEESVSTARAEGKITEYGKQLYRLIYGTVPRGKALPSGDIDPRSLADQGVNVDPYTMVDRLPAITAAANLCTLGGMSGMARQCYRDATATLSNLILDTVQANGYYDLQRVLLGRNSDDPFAMLSSQERTNKYLGGLLVPFSVLSALGATDEDIKRIRAAADDGAQQFGLSTHAKLIKSLNQNLFKNLLIYKASQIYGLLGARLVASRIAGNLLDTIQGRNRVGISTIFEQYFKYDDPSAKQVLSEYLQNLDPEKYISSTPGKGLSQSMKEFVYLGSEGFGSIEKSEMNKLVDEFFEAYDGTEGSDAFKLVLDLESGELSPIAKAELLPSTQEDNFMPTSKDWVWNHSAGDVLAQAYRMVSALRNEIRTLQNTIGVKYPQLKGTDGKLDTIKVDLAVKSPAQFTNLAGNTADWNELKKLNTQLTRAWNDLHTWRTQQTLAQNLWKNTLFMFTAPKLAGNTDIILREAVDSARSGMVKALKSVIGEDGILNVTSADQINSFISRLNEGDISTLTKKESAKILGYIYSRGGLPLDNSEVDLAPKQRMAYQSVSESAQTYDKKGLRSAILGANSFEDTFTYELNSKSASSIIYDLENWNADPAQGYLPRPRFNKVPPEVMKALQSQYLYPQITEEDSENGHITRIRWLVKRYPGCNGTDRYPDAKKVICEEVRTDKGSTRIFFDPSEPGSIREDGPMAGFYVSRQIYIGNMTKNGGKEEKYYDATYDPKSDDDEVRSSGYLGGLCSYSADLTPGASIPYISIKTTKKSSRAEVCNASGVVTSLTDAVDQYKNILEERASVKKRIWEDAIMRERSELSKSLMAGFGGGGVANAISYVSRVLDLFDSMSDQKFDELKRLIPAQFIEAKPFFEVQKEVEKIWNGPENREVKVDKLNKLIEKYAKENN